MAIGSAPVEYIEYMDMDMDPLSAPIAFCSKTLTQAERNYSISDRELLSINIGHFLELATLLATKTEELDRHLKSGANNAQYTSPDIQKEIVATWAAMVEEKIKEFI